MIPAKARLAVDIGGTFTDVVLEHGTQQTTAKVLTTAGAPELGVLQGVAKAMADAGLSPGDVGLLIHGTTLATNALIERKGAKTALITTEGHRDAVEMALENRFEQYDINIDRPKPLVPRYLRWPVTERLNVRGETLLPLDLASVDALLPLIAEHQIEALAVGLLHAYASPAHEQAVRDRIQSAYPDLAISLSSDVAPEIREYERQSTTCANAYVQPKMAGYLTALDRELKALGYDCPFLLMTSGGGLTDLATAVRFPIRLVESGPAGGAILAARIAEEMGLDRVLSYDMGGTTAKICLIDDFKPLSTRTFEVARGYRNMKGSGLPVKIPAIEMVEIGAGGGSLASVDGLGRVAVGPESAGSQPGPACYGLGGTQAAVTDADLVLGKIDPAAFAGGSVKLEPEKAGEVLEATIGKPLGMDAALAAFAVAEIVDENMANAARVHAVEWGKDVASRTMIAFGGAAPLHAARLAEKLNLAQVIVPAGAGVGSAVGFLRAPISYEVVRSRYMRLDQFDAAGANILLARMKDEAEAIVRQGAPSGELTEVRLTFMRYVGQGHEITVALPGRALTPDDADTLRVAFAETYSALYGQTVPGQEPEILTWTLTVSTEGQASAVAATDPASDPPGKPTGSRRLFDSNALAFVEAAVWRRESMGSAVVQGPALIVEDQTTTIVPDGFTAALGRGAALVLSRT
ncbi:MAG: hydantoinase/oxoprolinase family protein, partial [Alphaproteobacteria bacterium]|jgi:N-methylhydantoinase A